MTNFGKFAQFLCIAISLGILDTIFAQYQHFLDSSNYYQLYTHSDEPMKEILAHGDSEFAFMQFENPVHFYSEKYDHIYINTNGILTFNTEFPEYLNQPFPLEYPSIAAFYSNVDTTGANGSTTITLFKSQNEEKLRKASNLIRYAYPNDDDFKATTLIIATWENVGYFNGKTDKLNTFQAVLICNEDETYVQFIYPRGGLNWVQADTGELGLPDIRAQVGFTSEDARFYSIEGSGTENARYFTEMSNIGVNGVFLYRVGLLDYDANITDPSNQDSYPKPPKPQTCTEGQRTCHLMATCIDKSYGFCCRCPAGDYGNGKACIKNTVPVRVVGSLSGTINNKPIDSSAKMQSYVVLQDGRTYTAINPITSDLGDHLKLALPILSSIGWLFAKPTSPNVSNGYQITGGELSHVSKLTFTSGEVLVINQTFEGLNYWDQLTVKIDISGQVPPITFADEFQMNTYLEEFMFTSPNTLVASGNRRIEIPSKKFSIEFHLDQKISFEQCLLDHEADPTGTLVKQSVSKVTFAYSVVDQALRAGMLAKIGVDGALSNPCADSSAACPLKSLCVPQGDSYNCVCLDGYNMESIGDNKEDCIDIDECAVGTHICSDNAHCINIPGGYECRCYEGYYGNGYQCEPQDGNHIIESTTEYSGDYDERRRIEEARREQERVDAERRRDEETRRYNESREEEARREKERREYEDRREEARREAERKENERRYEENQQNLKEDQNRREEEGREEHNYNGYDWTEEEDEHNSEQDLERQPEPSSDCYRCSKDANCVEGHCVCREGHNGDGFSCQYNCRTEIEIWENGKCVLIQAEEILPVCTTLFGCSCPEGYELYKEENICKSTASMANEKGSGIVPCDVDNSCHENATCEWSEHEMSHICMCINGFAGDGFTCSKIDESCTTNPDICGAHATCEYSESLGKSKCQCEPHYEGDGFRCELGPECRADTDCGQSSYCDKGVCQCLPGYERDLSDFCVLAGMCGGTYCADNAMCKWDAAQRVQYCECMEGYTGNGVNSCKSIPTSCRVRNTCGVHATCEQSRRDPSQYECICNSGYYGDGYLCTEEQNCQNSPWLCDRNAKCLSTNNGIACVCDPGYLGNGTICRERPTYDSGFLLVSQGVVIVRVPFNGKASRPISVASMAIGLDKDCIEGRVYWGDISAKKIMSVKYDGTDSRAFITDDIESPEGIAIDSVSRRIYWTDSVKDTIEVASLDDPTIRAVLVNKYLVNPRGIAVDPYREKLYWSDWNRESPKIEMSDLDGTGREILLAKPNVVLPNSLVILKNSGELCFADAGSHKIECIDSYSKEVRTVASDLSYPFGLSATDNGFYWTDWTTKRLESIDYDGKRQPSMRTPVFGSHKMYGMTAVEDYCPQVSSPCQINNGGCPVGRICLANRKAPSGKSCKCTRMSKTCDVNFFNDNME